MKTFEVVLQRVEADLAAGRLRLGDRLPGERALAAELEVSRPSVREAVRVLEAMGVVRTAVGSGPHAGAIIVAEPSSPLTSTLRLHLATRHLPMGDIVRTRVLMESWAVREAAGRADPGEITAAGRLLEAMDDPELPRERFHLLDAEFHVALAALAGNVLVSTIMASLREAIHGYVMDAAPNLPDWATAAERLRHEHRAVLAAIEAGEADLAAERVATHIEGFYRATHIG